MSIDKIGKTLLLILNYLTTETFNKMSNLAIYSWHIIYVYIYINIYLSIYKKIEICLHGVGVPLGLIS